MQRKQITEDTIEDVFQELDVRFHKKGKKKGMMGFSSMWEIYGKAIAEEGYEVLQELHKKDEDAFISELYDVCIGCLFGIMSLRQK